MAMSKIILSLSPTPPPTTIPESHPHPHHPHHHHPSFFDSLFTFSRRSFILTSSVLSLSPSSSSPAGAALAQTPPAPPKSPPPPPPPSSSSPKSFLSGIGSTKSWFQFYGSGFAIRVPPNFEDIMEPEDYNAGLSLYGDKAKPKTYAARFASPDGSEVLSVVVRPSNQLKITFLEAKDIADLGSLKEASRIFVPVGVTLYSARIIKIKEEDGYRNYYFYEFGADEQRVALVAAVNSGKVIIAGVTAPQNKWDDHGVRLRSAAVSLTLV